MSKRQRSLSLEDTIPSSNSPSDFSPPLKRTRLLHKNGFNKLSDELVLKVLAFLTPVELTHCQQVCRRFFRIAGDSQVWKSAFYDRFVRPRASRLPGISRPAGATLLPTYSSRMSKWLDDEALVKAGNTNWKQLYKLRHNWNRGRCDVSEIKMSTEPSQSPLSIKMRMGIVFTIDATSRLQAWKVEGEKHFITGIHLHDDFVHLGLPTALAVDENGKEVDKDINVVVGFESGRYAVYQLDLTQSMISCRYIHSLNHGVGSSITTMAYSGSHLITMNASQVFTLYHWSDENVDITDSRNLGTPSVVTSLKSHTAWPPVLLSIRRSVHAIFACIVYAFPTFNMGWSVGMQELRLSSNGSSVQQSRIASAVPPGFHLATPSTMDSASSAASLSISPGGPFWESMPQALLSQPCSFSYAHPYLLAAHKDNTLTLYLVKSTSSSLEITAGQRLYGHTSAVSGAHVESRGRAVSISRRGSELRVWELEGVVSGNRRGRESVEIYPSQTATRPVSTQSDSNYKSTTTPVHLNWWDSAVQNKWLGFDEQQVIVHRQNGTGSQVLMVYNFT